MELVQLQKKIAYLEFVNDQLMSEIESIDSLFRRIGFNDGIQTIKTSFYEVLEEENLEEE